MNGTRDDRVIRISGDVYDAIVGRITAYGETPDSILRSLLDLPKRAIEPRGPRGPRGRRKPLGYYGGLLRSIRESKGWTQSELAEEMGVTIAAISHWETGRVQDPIAKHARRIVDLAKRLRIKTGGKQERDDGR